MNLLIVGVIVAVIVASVLLVGGVALVNAYSGDNTIDNQGQLECSTCGNSCTAESNCGLETCGAVSGSGSCGCGR